MWNTFNGTPMKERSNNSQMKISGNKNTEDNAILH